MQTFLERTCLLFLIGAAMLFFYFCVPANFALAGEQAGMITDLKGTVNREVTKTGVDLLDTLNVGDVLNGGSNARITIVFFKDGHSESLAGSFEIKVTKSALEVIKAQGKVTKKPPSVGSDKNAIPRPVQLAKGGAMITRGGFARALSPAYEKCAESARPELHWVRRGDSFNFVLLRTPEQVYAIKISEEQKLIEIKNADKDYSIYEGKVSIPDSIPALKRDEKYEWCLNNSERWPTDMGDEDKIFPFNLPPEEDEELLKQAEKKADALYKKNPDDISPYMELISLYIDKNVYGKAAEKALQVSRQRPQDPNIYALLAKIFFEMKQWELHHYAISQEQKYRGNEQ